MAATASPSWLNTEHEAVLRELVEQTPSSTLLELQAKLNQRGIEVGKSSIARLYPAPLLVAPANVARRSGDKLYAAIPTFATATTILNVIMSVIVTVILHGEIQGGDIRST